MSTQCPPVAYADSTLKDFTHAGGSYFMVLVFGFAGLGVGLWMLVGGCARRRLVHMLEDEEDDAIATADAVITAAYERMSYDENGRCDIYYYVSYTYTAESSSGRRYRGVVEDREVLDDVYFKTIQTDPMAPHQCHETLDQAFKSKDPMDTLVGTKFTRSLAPGLTAEVKYHHDHPHYAMLADNHGVEHFSTTCVGWPCLVGGVVILLLSLRQVMYGEFPQCFDDPSTLLAVRVISISGAALEVLIVFLQWWNYGHFNCFGCRSNLATLKGLDSDAESLVSGDSS